MRLDVVADRIRGAVRLRASACESDLVGFVWLVGWVYSRQPQSPGFRLCLLALTWSAFIRRGSPGFAQTRAGQHCAREIAFCTAEDEC
jgi:hypothetical protein